MRTAENVAEEIKSGIKIFNLKYFFIADDCFTLNKNRTKELCNLLIDIKKNNNDFRFSCEARADTINSDNAKLLSQAGCMGIQFGLESGSQAVLNNIGKGTTLDNYRNAVANCKKENIDVTLSFLFPNPIDTLKTVEETKKFIYELYDLGASSFIPALTTPFPGTDLSINRDKYGITLLTKDWDRYSCNWPVITTRHFGLDEIRRIYTDFIDICLNLNTNSMKSKKPKVTLTKEQAEAMGQLGIDINELASV